MGKGTQRERDFFSFITKGLIFIVKLVHFGIRPFVLLLFLAGKKGDARTLMMVLFTQSTSFCERAWKISTLGSHFHWKWLPGESGAARHVFGRTYDAGPRLEPESGSRTKRPLKQDRLLEKEYSPDWRSLPVRINVGKHANKCNSVLSHFSLTGMATFLTPRRPQRTATAHPHTISPTSPDDAHPHTHTK